MDLMGSAATWFCEPPRWRVDEDGVLVIEPAAATDFWRTTHYGFIADNGHFAHREATGDFVLTARVSFAPVNQYDQAGLMVRVSPTCWLKTSVEYEPDGPARLGAVVTNAGHSDWSTQAFERSRRSVWLRVRREGVDYLVETSDDGAAWTQIRMARLLEDTGGTVLCGPYACSPRGAGFSARFEVLAWRPGRVAADHA